MRWSVNRVLAAAALFLGVLAPLAGNPLRDGHRLDRDDPARVGAAELAKWLMERREVRVLDLRDSSRFEVFHLPRAELVRPADLEHTSRAPGDTIVLYGDEVWVARALRTLAGGPGSVRFMVDGVGEWLSEIMNPIIAPDATPEERAAFDRVADLSRYFGGMPRIGTSTDTATSEQLLRRTVRRGCAF